MCKYVVIKTFAYLPIKKLNLRGTFPKLDVIIEECEPDESMKRKTTDEQSTNACKKIKYVSIVNNHGTRYYDKCFKAKLINNV